MTPFAHVADRVKSRLEGPSGPWDTPVVVKIEVIFFFGQIGSKSAQNGLIYHTKVPRWYTELVQSPGEDILFSVFLWSQRL